MVDEHGAHDMTGLIKAGIILLITWLADAFVQNPIGTAVSIIGLLLMYEKWRTQKLIRKQKQKELDNEGDS